MPIPTKSQNPTDFWLRGFVLIILNLFLRNFAISAFLKVILAIGTFPMSRVTCPNVENPENQADQS